jgi:lipid-A-disaccharide synthase-like uncharacterized protein
MHEDWRTFLYPLGFIASFSFGARFILQWILSEKKRESHINSYFWTFSLIGNILMAIHTFIQVQYPFCVIQSCNAVLSWRNLELMKNKNCGSAPVLDRRGLRSTLLILALAIFIPTFSFVIEGFILYDTIDWVRTPTLPWSNAEGIPLPLGWHILGFVGAALFAFRFWMQWWCAEKHQIGYLGQSFWWFSIVGASLALIYFIHLQDWVNIIGYGLGIVPYIRNIMLLNQNKKIIDVKN